MTHNPDHFFQTVCICPCEGCTDRNEDGDTVCICPMCPPTKCGMKVKKK